ncbi:MAG: hypothetical protein KDB63_01395 [Nocardioidaceae bacterium]|nr:hypothetical protein [Nocardioidaceae bacterium]
MPSSRSLTALSRALAVLACLVLPLALVSAWVSMVATDTDRYVRTVGPLADSQVVKDEVEKRIETRVMSSLDVQTRIRQLTDQVRNERLNGWLRAHQGELGDGVRNAVRAAVRRAVVTVVDSDQFRPAWEEANRSAHAQLIAVLEGDSGALDDRGNVSVPLGTLIGTALGILVDEGLLSADRVPEIDASFPLLDADQVHRAQRLYRLVRALGVALPVLTLVLALAAVVVGPQRRRVVVWLGVGAALAAGVVLALLVLGRGQVLGMLGQDDRALVGAVWDVVARGLIVTVGVTAAVGLVAAAGGWLAGRAGRRDQISA